LQSGAAWAAPFVLSAASKTTAEDQLTAARFRRKAKSE
jgi:hypothetical protein